MAKPKRAGGKPRTTRAPVRKRRTAKRVGAGPATGPKRGGSPRPTAAGAAAKTFRSNAHVVSYDQVLAGAPGDVPSQAEYGLCILAEGDSWFSFGAIPGDNLLNELRFERRTIIVNAAYPGDTIRHLSELSDTLPLRRMLFARNFAFEWDLILLSGGGNDLIDAARSIIVAPPAGTSVDPLDYINGPRLATLIDDVQAGYRRLASLRDTSEIQANRDVPIVVHQYDFATPRHSPSKFLGTPVRGPWLAPALDGAGVHDPALRQAISDHLLRALGDGIAALAHGPDAIPNFHVVATRGTLDRADPAATGSSGDWLNEIHPKPKGYRKLGEKIAAAIEALPRRRP